MHSKEGDLVRVRFLLLIVLMAVLQALGLHAGPDFSGTWRLDRTLSDPAGPGKDVTLTIEQQGDALLIVRNVDTRAIEVRYDLAGGPTENTLPDGKLATSTARWDGTTILITTQQHLGEGVVAAAEERISLTGSGHLRIEKRVQMPSTEFRSVEVFARQQPAEM